MTPYDREQHVLDLIVPRLEEDGYSVFVQPARSLLPSFMEGYVPDAIAVGKPKKLAIEIVKGDRAADRKLASVREKFALASDWELRVYYYRPESDDAVYEPADRVTIEATADRVEALAATGEPGAALLLGWAALEATGRLLLPEKLRRPTPAGRLLEILAQEGVVTPDESKRLRGLLGVRNRIAHGDLDARVGADDAHMLAAILRSALAEAEPIAQ